MQSLVTNIFKYFLTHRPQTPKGALKSATIRTNGSPFRGLGLPPSLRGFAKQSLQQRSFNRDCFVPRNDVLPFIASRAPTFVPRNDVLLLCTALINPYRHCERSEAILPLKKYLLGKIASQSLAMTLMVFLLSSCHNTTTNNTNTNTQVTTQPINAMSVYSSAIHSIKLPFIDTCFDTIAIQHPKLPDSLSEFKNYGQIVGKVHETRNYVAILYSIPADVQLPVLRTFNTNGQKISSLRLFIGDCCGENEDCSGQSTFEITGDMHIILRDSMQTFERDKKKYDKKKNFQMHKKMQEFKIDSNGKIIQMGSKLVEEILVKATLG